MPTALPLWLDKSLQAGLIMMMTIMIDMMMTVKMMTLILMIMMIIKDEARTRLIRTNECNQSNIMMTMPMRMTIWL